MAAQRVPVRRATTGDLAVLAGIAGRAYREAFGAILEAPVLSRLDESHFSRRFRASLPGLLVAEDAAGPLGFALVAGPTLSMLFVDPSRHGAGAGAALLLAAEAHGAWRLETFRDNGMARRFYEVRGWRPALAYRRPLLGGAHDFVSYVRASA